MWLLGLAFIAALVWYFTSRKKPDTTSESSAPAEIHTSVNAIHLHHEDGGKDAWEGAFYDVIAQRSANKTVRIRYTDAMGNETDRVVDIRAFEPEGADGLVIGHCHTRNATRTFRFNRMRRVVEEETGEIIPDLQKMLNDEWQASPEPLKDQLYRENHDVLKLLLYMAKADGAVRAAEIEVIARYCQELTGNSRINAEIVKDLLKTVDVVTPNTFARIYNKLRRERVDEAAKAADACRAIVGTQKTIHPHEQAALDVLNGPLPNSIKFRVTDS